MDKIYETLFHNLGIFDHYNHMMPIILLVVLFLFRRVGVVIHILVRVDVYLVIGIHIIMYILT